MKTTTPSLIVISFSFKSCRTRTTNDSKEISLFTDKNLITNQIPLYEQSKLQSVNNRSLIVLNHSIQKNILITEIKTENTTISKEIISVTSSCLPIIVPIAALNSDFVFDDYTFSEN
ncbi:hypothetical protein SAMN05192550_0763 [Flavobacterium glycines]|uniref:Uncharacterized protein n=1 Tax=Flavobacterium glycines TaxID=551990 RepID=A0A1B9DTQ9_9FLAO|nr:hypothetical protein [Flavobacterium glycines]OCB73065.1 hypothetical protein FBGL_04120 [Flavobacterium glycines]GEL10211.1 hypothetical protein FGL01_09500 [Flavobacterium glycines]SDI76877.1 hypothetical protein SAMN05192550_0763 [Flavobacterium glycines]